MLSQNIALWHINDFQLKLFKKKPMEKGHADLHLYSRNQEINLPLRVPVVAQGVKNPTSIH